MEVTWIRVAIDLPEHPKSLLLEQELGEPNAWAYMQKIWGWCSKYAKDGKISGLVASIVERAAGWRGEPGKLLQAAEKVRFLDLDNAHGGWHVHKWDEHQGAAIKKAEKDAGRKREAYESAKAARQTGEVADSARRSRGEVAESPARRAGTRRDETRRDELLSKNLSSAPPPETPKETLPLLTPEENEATSNVSRVLDHYLEAMRANEISARATQDKRDLIRKRLNDKWKPEQLVDCIDALTWSDWHMGRDPKTKGKKYCGLDYAIGNAKRIEDWLNYQPWLQKKALKL